jgi:CIC family chloride channel protein
VVRLQKQWLHWRRPDGWHFAAGAAVVVGVSAALGVALFKFLFEGLAHLSETLVAWAGPWGSLAGVLVLMLGGVLVSLISRYWIGAERHHGVAGVIESVALAGGRLRYWRLPAKVLGSAISIGSGASVGPEDPSVQIGSNLGSAVGQLLRMPDERTRVLVAAGAAAGVAAAFNAPIAGVFFAIEIILGELGGSALGVVLLASVISAATTQAIAGPEPAFSVPVYQYGSPLELPLYLGLGLLAGPLAALYVRLLYAAQDAFAALRLPFWGRPLLAALLVGGAGVFLPQILGVGYPAIEQILDGELAAASLLALLALAKLLATPISIGGGFLGGVFAPALFIGAAFGGAYGAVTDRLLPGLDVPQSSFAMVGMAAMLAGAVHAPLTAILLLFEMTNDYRIILPLMLAVAASLALSQRLQRDSVYTLGLARKGVRIERGRDVDVLASLRVDEVMQRDALTLAEDAPLEGALEQLMRARSHGAPVVDTDGRLIGILSLQDIDRAEASGGASLRAGDACTPPIPTRRWMWRWGA